jgi:hypothetical protein
VFDVAAVAAATGRPMEEVLVEALGDGTLPARWRAQEAKLVALVALGDLGHVAAGRQVGWSRWTVAEWRRRLGLIGP